MIRSDLCHYSHSYILVSGTIKITGEEADDAEKQADERNEGVIFNTYAPFAECVGNVNNTQTDNAKDIDFVMPIYNLIEYHDNYLQTSGSLWQCYRNEPNDNIAKYDSFTIKNPKLK